MRFRSASVPMLVSSLALGIALASYVMPHSGSAAVVQPAPLPNDRRIELSAAARITSLEGRADAAETRLAQAQRDVAALQRDLTAFKTHRHTYAGGLPGFGIVNVATLKQMMDRMSPSDVKGTLPIAFDGVSVTRPTPQTGPAFVP